ncbi:hypothetical protein [Acinetobacter ursingii]|uniref:hypothetical protein n=1 Tax=Acinetobacter ursingii TaxID=108980 RepID=UPI0030085273
MSDQVSIAAISAGGVLLGVFFSQIIALITTFLNRKYERQSLLRQKYEKMVEEYNLSMKLFSTNAISNLDNFECAIFAKNAHSLSMIYFPKIYPYSAKFYNSLLNILDAYNKNDHENIEVLLNSLRTSRQDLEEAISTHSKYYT